MANKKQIEDGTYLIDPQAEEMITVSTVAKTLTSGTYGTNSRAQVQGQDNNMRYWATGTAPTSTTGILLTSGSTIELRGNEIANFKIIKDSAAGGDGKIAVQYYK